MLGRTAPPSLSEAITVIDVTALDYDELQLLAEVNRLVDKAAELAGGSVPAVGTPAWWDAEPMARIAALLALGQQYLLDDPHQLAAEMVKDASSAISTGMDWASAAQRLVYDSHAKVAERRREPGPLAGVPFDSEGAARWVQTGSSEATAA